MCLALGCVGIADHHPVHPADQGDDDDHHDDDDEEYDDDDCDSEMHLLTSWSKKRMRMKKEVEAATHKEGSAVICQCFLNKEILIKFPRPA